jgi:serine phosphatase RsbU (regulator of sigma subunit)
MEVQIAVAKIGKYATRESGDTFEIVERPHGGLSFVLADGQRSGRGAKSISNVVARKAIALLAEGIRDGAVARAAHDYLYTHRGGQVISTLNIVSLDLVTRTIVVSRNNPAPVYLVRNGEIEMLAEPSQPVGVHRGTKPQITQVPLERGLYVVVFTDGIADAGSRYGRSLDLPGLLRDLAEATDSSEARVLADRILAEALALDEGRPVDDMSVAVVAVVPRAPGDGARRLSMRFPLDD